MTGVHAGRRLRDKLDSAAIEIVDHGESGDVA